MTMSSARSKEAADLYIVAIKQQARHPLEQGNEAEQQADEHQPGQHDLQQGGGLNDVAAQCLAAAVSTWEECGGAEDGT